MRDDLPDFTARASAFLKILSGRTRIIVIWKLLDGEMSVTELATAVGVRSTSVSQQLAILRGEGMVTTRRSGQNIFYSLRSEEAKRFVAALRDMLEQAAKDADVEQAHTRAAEVVDP